MFDPNATGCENLLRTGCPWVELRSWGGLPNLKWCEETLCSWIAEPANTWSNLAYVVAAVALYAVARRESSRTLRFFAPAALAVGLCSFAYHASVAFTTQVLDFFGMYFYFLLLLALNFVRLGWLPAATLFRALVPGIFGFTLLTVGIAHTGLPVQGIIGVLVAATLLTEYLASRARAVPTHRFFWTTLAFIAVAFACSAADASRLWCDPSNHLIQGHALWHALGAAALFASYFHYRQFRPLYA
jgi:hypothetical protein